MSNLQFGEFTINNRLRELRRHDTVLPISGKAFDLLFYMASNAGRPLSKSELLQAVWPEMIVEESNLNQNVFHLRKVLGGGNEAPIRTLAGRGYQFAMEVRTIEPTNPTSSFRTSRIASQEGLLHSATIEGSRSRTVVQHDFEERLLWTPTLRFRKAASALGVVIILSTAAWLGWQRWLDYTAGPPVRVVLTAIDGSTGDPVLDSALVDALRMDLSQSPFVSVVSPSTIRATLTQMMRKPDTLVTAELARELCERSNGQAVLHSTIARSGQRFLLTGVATSCIDGSVLAQAKRAADKADDLPESIDVLAANLRLKLGESRRSVARFSTPLFPVNTGSLDALKDYSQASQLSALGKWPDAINLLQQAIAADPKFASAYYDLAVAYLSNGDFVNGRTILQKAYGLRDTASEPVRLAINALYANFNSLDLYEAERNDQNWTRSYPNSVNAWNLLSMVQRDLGHHADAVMASKHAVELAPGNQGMYVNLAFNQMRAGDLAGARATCDLAISKQLDGDRIRGTYLLIAMLMHDPALIQAQLDWGDAHPDAAFFHGYEVELAIGQGKFLDAHRLLSSFVDALQRQGLLDAAAKVRRGEGQNMLEAGDVEAGTRFFQSSPVDPESGSDLVGLAETGDIKTALADLHTVLLKYPHGTVWNQYYGPRIEATASMAKHNPQQAIAFMEATRPLDSRGLDHQRFRGDAYLAAGQPLLAEKEYRAVLAHREIDPILTDYPLSWLGLGRALAAKGDRAGAIDAYQHFLEFWSHADPDATFLQQGNEELKKLQKIVTKK